MLGAFELKTGMPYDEKAERVERRDPLFTTLIPSKRFDMDMKAVSKILATCRVLAPRVRSHLIPV
jgi:hypothetical protein